MYTLVQDKKMEVFAQVVRIRKMHVCVCVCVCTYVCVCVCMSEVKTTTQVSNT